MSETPDLPVIQELRLDLAQDNFIRTLLRELSGTLQDMISLEQASGFFSVVGQRMGDAINEMVFGVIASENLGYAKVTIEQAIARGDAGCRVVVYLKPGPESAAAEGREYYADEAAMDEAN